jgi:hypothetical protein
VSRSCSGRRSAGPTINGTYRPDAGQAAKPLLGAVKGARVDGAARALLVDRPQDNGSQDGCPAVVDFTTAGLDQQVLSDQASHVRCERDDCGPLLPGVRNQEHTAIEIHAGNDLNLKPRLDVRKIELKIEVHVTPAPSRHTSACGVLCRQSTRYCPGGERHRHILPARVRDAGFECHAEECGLGRKGVFGAGVVPRDSARSPAQKYSPSVPPLPPACETSRLWRLSGDEGVTDEEVVLSGGTMTAGVVRIGDTVRRPVGRWTPAVHSLLRHLEEVGFEGAPRVLGIDEKGREVLTYLPSDPTPSWSDEALVAVGRLLRRLHDALSDFAPSPGAIWRHPPLGRRAPSRFIAHGDLGPVNTVYAGGVPYGFIDWDMAGPAGPVHDLASAAIAYTALRPDRYWPRPGCPTPPDRPTRLRLLCDA